MKVATPMRVGSRRRTFAWLGLLCAVGLSGCSSLLPKPAATPALFVLGDISPEAADTRSKLPPTTGAATATLVVAEPRAAPGYGTRQIAYVRTPNQLEHFAFSQWAEPPALMLAPLLARAIEGTGAFRAVVRAPISVAGDLRLETELIRLHQDFSVAPSRVRLTVRAVLIDTATRRVLATREFDDEAPSPSEDPAGGVIAANLAAQRVAARVGAFCAARMDQAK